MSTIRPLERADLPDVVRLYTLVMRDGADDDPELERFFASTLLDHPWADPELPSLVAADEGRIVGFIGSNVRRITFDGRPMRMVCSAHLVSHPEARSQAVGAKLMRALLDGPQDLTITDGATDDVRRMWEAFGGWAVPLGALSFVRLLRPWSLGATMLHDRHELSALRPASRGRRERARPGDRGGLGRSLPPDRSDRNGRAADPGARRGARRPSRSRRTPPNGVRRPLPHVALRRARQGRGTRHAVGGRHPARPPMGRARALATTASTAGTSATSARRDPCRVLQLVATPRGADARLRAARASVPASSGQPPSTGGSSPDSCPRSLPPAASFGRATGGLLVHARDLELALAVRAGDALLARWTANGGERCSRAATSGLRRLLDGR